MLAGAPGACAADPIAGSVEDFQAIVTNLQADTALRDAFQGFGYQPVERLGAVAGQFPIELTIQFTQVGTAFDDIAAVGLGMDFLGFAGAGRAEFADDFREDVFQGDYAGDIAVFIDDDGNAPFVLFEVEQLNRQRSAFRDEVGGGRRTAACPCSAGYWSAGWRPGAYALRLRFD